ncbi:MAG: hypothetical protein JO246_13790 [Frankiaceae bacterium]|nr:hypothetical protein [Frankiaceae bacterium]MBV9873078.1 hypothetical protein [Frankiaceae bacterium]
MPNFGGLGRDDQVFIGAGALGFIFTFIAFAHIKIAGFGSDTASAWHGIGSFAALLLLAATVVGAVAAMSPSSMPNLPIGVRVLALGLSVLAFVFFIIRWVTLPGGDVLGHHYGYSLYWGGYILLILNLVQIGFGFKLMRASGESLPWEGGNAAPPPPAPPAA